MFPTRFISSMGMRRAFATPSVYRGARGFASATSAPSAKVPSPATTPSSADEGSSSSEHSIFDLDANKIRKVPMTLATPGGAYATTLFTKAKSVDDIVHTAKDLETFISVLNADKALANEVIDADAKPAQIGSFLSKYFDNVDVSPSTRDLFLELAHSSKFGLVGSITESLNQLINAGLGLVSVKVTLADKNAKAPTDEEIAKQLELAEGSQIETDVQYDKDLMGGYILQTEDKLFDKSYKKDIEALDENIQRYYRTLIGEEMAELDARVA